MKKIFVFTMLLLSIIKVQGQLYTVSMIGAFCVTLYENRMYFNDDNILGTYYQDENGIIRINLGPGCYQYIATERGTTKGMNGSFYVNRNIDIEIHMIPELYGIETERCNYKAYQLLQDGKKKKARELYLVSAQAGNVSAMFNLARMLYNGMGGRKDKAQAYYWMTEAMKRGNTNANRMLEKFEDKYFWKWNI